MLMKYCYILLIFIGKVNYLYVFLNKIITGEKLSV